MRKTIVSLLFYLTAAALAAQNNLRISAPDGTLFRVRTATGYSSAHPQTSLLIENIKTDTLSLLIESEGLPDLNTRIYLLEKGKACRHKEFNYSLRRNKNTLLLSYEGDYEVTPAPQPLVPKKPVADTMTAWRNRFMGHLCELKDGQPLFFNNLPETGSCREAMPDAYLGFAAQLVKRTDTDDERLNLIWNICRNNCLSVHQLLALLEHIPYELDRLKLVRDAHAHLTDPARAAELESAFRFEAAVQEFKTFLRNPPETYSAGHSSCSEPSDSSRVGAFRNTLSIYDNDAERMETFRKSYRGLCYSTEQIAQLLKIFIHDRERGQAAQRLYFYCSDPQNFQDLTGLFSDNVAKNMLRDFVEKQRK